ncbi:serine/threonine-protein kinase SAPK10 isoform 1 [Hibiscus syriacus]|uniref:Serine/threonine-protein kinase SAPK10 isoform 1 n=1 Tax=Hibiscus syriacus TaxID=106335 RepID=A0A6A3A679_HIBSY|nr:transcription factor HHO6-like [Hibiscus syriacus]KAE8698639.1 serine/threonine-protein kinase SAPK10 isoform 1 [Hibiscus syriacus]
MDLVDPEISLDFRPTFIPKTITNFLKEVSLMGNVSDKASKLNSILKGLEEEMKKIDAFKRELPLCMLLLNDEIVALKEESVQCVVRNVEPVLEEFIPLKSNEENDQSEEDGSLITTKKEEDSNNNCNTYKDKKNWMSSIQLWNTDDDDYCSTDHNLDTKRKHGDPCKYRGGTRDFTPFKANLAFAVRKEEKKDIPVPGLSLLTPRIKNLKEESGSTGSRTTCSTAVSSSATNVRSNFWSVSLAMLSNHQQQTGRKQRRCWSPELHHRFVNALQQLGGSQVATPKQIRELMQVDGLTNDEVKSHLQKYRLLTKRLAVKTTTPANHSAFVFGSGHAWISQDQYGESPKGSNSQSGSPQGPLQIATNTRGTSTTGDDSMGDDEDAKSECYSWKSHAQKLRKIDV